MDSERVLKEEDNGLKTETNYLEVPDSLFQYLSTGNNNVQNICRICLSTNSDVLYSLVSSEENSFLADMFMSLTSIRLIPEDGLPSNICEACHCLVMQYYEFKIKCENSDCMLKSILQGEFNIKDELTDNSLTVKEEINSDNNVKDELDFIEDVQYLEDLSDADDTDGQLCRVDAQKKTKTVKEEINSDVQYLKDQSDNADDTDGQLCIVDTEKRTKKTTKEVTIDSESNSVEDETCLTPYSAKKSTIEKQRTYTCTYCTRVFTKAQAFHVHMKRKHELEHKARPHPCSQCKETFDSAHDLNVHSALHSKGNFWQCNQCNKEYNTKATLRRHLQRHMHSKPHVCDSCPKAFTELYALRRHLRVHTGETKEKKHKCQLCDKRFSESSLLLAHVMRHAGARPCVCSSCGKRFPSPRLLTSHMLTHTDHKPYKCQHCDKRFRHESTRNTHHRTHTGEKPYVCCTCGKSFIQNSNLTLHMRTHTGERPYSCSMCERKFTSGSSLKSHERIHTGERPYSCTICGKRFARMNLAAHMRQHTGERPFACSACPKKFVNASRLRDHCRIHTGEKPYECAYCTFNFATKPHLIKHMKKVHVPPKKTAKQEIIIMKHDYNQEKHEINAVEDLANKSNNVKEIALEMPLEVTGELILQDDSNMKTELLVVDNSQINNGNICLAAGNVNIIDSEVNYENDVNLVTVNEGGVSISASTLEGNTVKLYQLDQSLVQINSSSGQVTISKITSKMTTNF